MLRQTSTTHINAQFSASRPGFFQVFRCMSNSSSLKVFVSTRARVIVDRETSRSRGFGFITYINNEDAFSAIQALDGQAAAVNQNFQDEDDENGSDFAKRA